MKSRLTGTCGRSQTQSECRESLPDKRKSTILSPVLYYSLQPDDDDNDHQLMLSLPSVDVLEGNVLDKVRFLQHTTTSCRTELVWIWKIVILTYKLTHLYYNWNFTRTLISCFSFRIAADSEQVMGLLTQNVASQMKHQTQITKVRDEIKTYLGHMPEIRRRANVIPKLHSQCFRSMRMNFAILRRSPKRIIVNTTFETNHLDFESFKKTLSKICYVAFFFFFRTNYESTMVWDWLNNASKKLPRRLCNASNLKSTRNNLQKMAGTSHKKGEV